MPEAEKSCGELKITPEMIEAGVLAYVKRDDVFETREEIVLRIFRDMIAAAKRAAPASPSSPE
jgi:hypothetical protein